MSSSDKIQYDKKVVLGKGAFSRVFKGTYNGEEVAVKRVDLLEYTANERELRTLRNLDHPNVVKFYHAESDGRDFMLYAMELCAASLLDYCTGKYRGPIPAKIEAMIQMTDGLNYIHSKKFVHRDVKPENILISCSKPVQLKLGDFGLSKPTDSRGVYSLKTGVYGTDGWLAPELLQLCKIDKKSNTELYMFANNVSDIFALGCVFFYFLVKSHPFGEGPEISNNIMKDYPLLWIKKAGSGFEFGLIRQMIRAKPMLRISLDEVAFVLRIYHAGKIYQNSGLNQDNTTTAQTQSSSNGVHEIHQPQQGKHRHQQSSSHSAGHSTYSSIADHQQVDSSTHGVLKKSKSTFSIYTQKLTATLGLKTKSSENNGLQPALVVTKTTKQSKHTIGETESKITRDKRRPLSSVSEENTDSASRYYDKTEKNVAVSPRSPSSESTSGYGEDLQFNGDGANADEADIGNSIYVSKKSQSSSNTQLLSRTQSLRSPTKPVEISRRHSMAADGSNVLRLKKHFEEQSSGFYSSSTSPSEQTTSTSFMETDGGLSDKE